ncbi:cilia- and flagella-associated protein 46 isoform B [Alligator mississippiensis]|uniref:Cilia- and flagella-associated protein 46 isoform B n=1 Tax=Alligator mississippiensis TaxID=8496 RepID=A0A151P0B3_ALLMI|nr:cilia- and flagella-associated protein 46 isoform B [Alligator mississippiensis]
MDSALRLQLLSAPARPDSEALKNAYEMIKSANQGKSALDSSESFSSDLYVLCAEQALELGYLEISSDCLQMYFKGRYPVNQFIGRAYLCQGQLFTPLSTENLENFEKFVMFFMKAVDFAINDPRYYFLIYNASVLYWNFISPYLKPGFRCHLISSLYQIVAALNQVGEQDKEWRAELMIELLECYLDASKMKEAVNFSSIAAAFIKDNAPDKYQQIFSLMVRHKLMNTSQIEGNIRNSISLSAIYKIQTIKSQLDANEFPREATANLSAVYELLKQYDTESASFILGEKIPLLLELARLSLKLNCIEVAFDCIHDLKRAQISDPGKLIEIECLECEYEVQKLGRKISSYTKGAVETQLKVIRRLELALQHAVRVGDPNVVQAVCATQWNLCLPLLQHNLLQHVKKPLISVADILEKIDSSLILLRCQVHMEIARIEENGDRIEAAMEHLKKAIYLDNNGQYQEHLKMAFNRLHLCTMLYKSPERLEDQAIMMIEQAKKGKLKDSVRKKRSLLVNAGLALAPDAFQIVLDSENEAQVSSGKSRSKISYLHAKAQHHIKSVEKADGHLKRLGHRNDKERVSLWADLAKVARKQEVWDVCRTACRFCLLYDDTQLKKVPKSMKAQKKKPSIIMMDDNQGDSLQLESSLPLKSFSFEKDLLRTLAEIRFINAEAIIHLLRLQGVQLNDHADLPQDTSQHSPGYLAKLPEQDQEWITYSLWIDHLSQYAMENFLRAAEIGEELNEAWIVHNTVVYVLNYNKHLIASGRQREIVESLQTLLSAVKNTGHCGNIVVLLMLCNALARGLILFWIPKPIVKFDEKKNIDTATSDNKRTATKGPEKTNLVQSLPMDPNRYSDIKAAIEVCEFALSLINGNASNEVPISVQQQVIAAWVKAKQLHQQQIGQKLGTDDENNDEGQNPISKVLVALEMYSCNGLGLMDFTVPSLAQLVRMTLKCSWSDPLVELQTLTRLTYFAYVSHDHEIVMMCSQRIMQFDDIFLSSTDGKKCEIHEYTAGQELLSTAACIQGKSIMENLSGRHYLRLSASKAFVQSARYAGEAGNCSLVMLAARHFWNTCLPFIGSPRDREQLKEPTEIILKSIIKAESKTKQEKENTLPLHQWITKDFQTTGSSDGDFLPGTEEDLTLRTSLYGLLFHVHDDKGDWETGLKVLEEAIQVLPRTKHRLLIFKHMVIVKTRLGCNFMMDIQKFREESEDYLSNMWHHLASVSKDLVGQLTCYQNAIEVLQKKESQWQKVHYLMEFSEWLYYNQFPLDDVIKHLDWAINILLHMKFATKPLEEGEKNLIKETPSSELMIDLGKKNTIPQVAFQDLQNIRQLENLFRAYTLIAIISGRSSPYHQQHCLMAYACIIRIWQVSLSAAGSVIKVLAKPSQTAAFQNVQPNTLKKDKGNKDTKQVESTTPKKGKAKKDTKQAQASVTKDKPKQKGPVDTLPASVEEWATYDCPDEVRDAFKQEASSCGINQDNIRVPELQKTFCTHLILPIFQLAEVIAHEVLESKSLSDLYRLRIALICSDMKLNQASSYHEKAVGEAYINEVEQAMCRQEIALEKEHNVPPKEDEISESFEHTKPDESPCSNSILKINAATGKGLSGLSFPYLWIDKAEVLIQLGLYQPARLLLAEAHSATQELNDGCAVSRCLYLLAVLANLEKNYGQAKALLEKAQNIGGKEWFWYNSTLSLIEAVLGKDEEEKEEVICRILQKNINVFRSILVERPNRESELGFMITSLEARKTIIQINFAQDYMKINAESSQLTSILQLYEKLIQIEDDFHRYGYKDHSAEILQERANIHRLIAKYTRDEEEKHHHYLDAYTLTQRAVSEKEELFHNVCSLLSVQEIKNISIPLMRQLANMKLRLVEIILDILHLVNTEKKLKELREGSLTKIVEEFVRLTPHSASVEQGWINMRQTVGHIALAHLVSLQSLYAGCPDIKAKHLYLTGKTLHLLAVKADPLHSDTCWKENIMEETKLNSMKPPMIECNENKMARSSSPSNKKQFEEQKKKANELKKRLILAKKYLSQSSEVLLQCMNVAFSNNIINILTSASLEMVECLGRFDPVSSSQFLALHQSCSASLMMKDILLAATPDTMSSQLAALLHFQHHLKQKGDISSLSKNVEQRLASTSKAWENLCVPAQHFNIVNELPPNFHIVILQHSEDGSSLYSAIIKKPKFSSGQQKGKPIHPTVQAKVSRISVNPDTLLILLEKVRLYKQERMNSFFKQELPKKLHTGKVYFQNWQESSTEIEMDLTEKINENERKLTSDFCEILKDMEEYLQPVLSQFDSSDFREQSQTASPAESGKTKAKDKEVKHTAPEDTPMDLGESLILLADKLLMELPLEALSIFQEEAICSISRDFSLQLLYNRIHIEEPENEVKKDVKSSKEPKPKANQKKSIKIVPVNRVLPPNCMPVDMNNFKYIVDPYNETKETEAISPSKKIREILQKYQEQFTSHWEGVIGSIRVPSQAEWEQLLSKSSAFLFYGMERVLSHILLDRLVAMNIPECQLMILLDLMQSTQSSQRLTKTDIHRSSRQKSLERPTETAILLSLTGVRSIIANQWYTSLEGNAENLETLSENLLRVGKSTGQTVRILQKNKTREKVPSINVEEDYGISSRNRIENQIIPNQSQSPAIQPSSFNCVLYGLPNLIVM